MAEAAPSQISEAMNRLWQKFLPQMEERVATLAIAADRLESGASLTSDEQLLAAGEAHKLAGVLGTFGLKEGTELAREAEGIFEGLRMLDTTIAKRLTTIAESLKEMITNRG